MQIFFDIVKHDEIRLYSRLGVDFIPNNIKIHFFIAIYSNLISAQHHWCLSSVRHVRGNNTSSKKEYKYSWDDKIDV